MADVRDILQTIPANVTVVAVSKLQPAEAVRRLHSETGIQNFGENYVQEALPKQAELGSLDLCWHFIGRLQKNKVKRVVGNFSLIHSVDSLELAQWIDRLAGEKGIRQNILLQMNIASEASKGGFSSPESIDVAALKACRNISIKGLMTMPPLSENVESVRPFFRELKKLKIRLQSDFPELSVLSMGTSSDYRIAIEEGATLVRLGTILFGPRPTK